MNATYRRIAAITVAVALVGGCAPDERGPAPGYNGYLDVVARNCYPDTIGTNLVRDVINYNASAGFLDATSKLYYGKMDPVTYRKFVTAFSDNSAATNKAIDCILSYLPSSRPQSPGAAPRDGVPPPPPSR